MPFELRRPRAALGLLILSGVLAMAAQAAEPSTSQPVVIDEINDSNAPANLPPPACPVANCGTVISIALVEGNADVQPGGAVAPPDEYDNSNPYQAFDWVNLYGYDLWDPGPVWQIGVRLTNGAVQIVQQNYKPYLKIGDTVVVEGNSVRIWP